MDRSLSFPLFLSLLVFAASACTEAVDDDLAPVSVATFPIADGTPDAVGLLDLLNDPATTMPVLDDDAGLDRRAAHNLILAREALPAKKKSTFTHFVDFCIT